MYAQVEKPKANKINNSNNSITQKISKKIKNYSYPLIQRAPVRTTGGGWIKNTLTQADFVFGSDTNAAVRTDVNSFAPTRYGTKVDLNYKVGDGATAANNGLGGLTTNETITDIDNQQKTFWHAGHILGSQNGGSGTDIDNIFRQDPTLNVGMGGRNAEWRAHEDKFHNDLVNSTTAIPTSIGSWSVKVHN